MKIKSGKITIADPCYECGTWGMIENLEFPNGEYVSEYTKKDNIVTQLLIKNKNVNKSQKLRWKMLPTEIGVDSGQAGIFDADYYTQYHDPDTDDDWYNRICDITLSDDQFGEIDEQGCASSSGNGDGCYIAYIGYNKNDTPVAVKIKFI